MAFFMAFTLDVTARAEQVVALPNDFAGVQLPGDCREVESCAASVGTDRKLTLRVATGRLILGPGSLGLRNSDRFVLIKGHGLVRAERPPVIVETSLARITVNAGYALVARDGDEASITAIDGTIDIQPHRGSPVRLIPGQSVRLGPLMETGHNAVGFVARADTDRVVLASAPLFDGDRKAFREMMGEFRLRASEQVFQLAALYEERVRREVSVFERRQEVLASERARRERDDAAMRKLFRDRNTFRNQLEN
jgi:hypothetical protein